MNQKLLADLISLQLLSFYIEDIEIGVTAGDDINICLQCSLRHPIFEIKTKINKIIVKANDYLVILINYYLKAIISNW